MTFPKYPEYKDSGVESVGKIPSHWTPRRIRSITSIQKGKLPKTTNYESNLESDLPYLTMEYLRGNEESISSMFIPIEDQTIVANEGDILVLWDGSNAGEFLKAKKGVVSSTLAIIKNLSVEKNYLFYGLKSIEKYLKDQTIGMGIPHVSNDTLRNLIIYLPSDNEQKIVVKFLSHETTKIDTLVDTQEKLIELLKEKRQAVISNAVTKGLDPKAKMKDSGVEWLGLVPEHWKVKYLRHIAKIVRGASPRPAGDPKYFSQDDIDGTNTPWVTVAEITKDQEIYLRSVSEYLTPEGVAASQKFEAGTLIFSNSGATLGVPKILEISCCANDGVLAFKNLSKEIDAEFLYFYLLTTTDRLRTEMKQGGGQPNLNTDIVKNIGLRLPSREEQDDIVKFLKNELNEFSNLIASAEISIDLLQERRSALISAAVTGQIDVRNYENREVA